MKWDIWRKGKGILTDFLKAFRGLRMKTGYFQHSLLRLDRATALAKVKEFVEERSGYYSGFFACTSSVRSITEYEHIMIMLALLITQGIAR